MRIFKIAMILLMVSTVFLIGAEDDIHQAIEKDNTAKVKELLTKNPTLLNHRNKNGRTPLHTALRSREPKFWGS